MKNIYTSGKVSLPLIAIIFVLIAVFIFIILRGNSSSVDEIASTNSEEMQTEEMIDSETLQEESVPEEPEVATEIMEDTETVPAPATNIQEATVTSIGTYTEYDESLLANANNGTVILFFHASWCPSCRALDNDINANLNNLPGDVTILRLDYDSETELKKKYGVVRQHTLVQVDANGDEIMKINGLTNSLEQVLSKL